MNRYSAIALVLLAAGSANAAERNLDRTFTVTPGGTLVVDADSASVQVTGVETNQVTVHMSARGSEDDRSFWRAAVSGERTSDDYLARAIALLRSSEDLSETVERARHYGRRALDALAPFPAGKAKAALSEAVEFAISRAY